MRGEFVDVDGARIYYYAAGTRGTGEPILLIHGFPTSSHLWRDLVPLLPEGHRVVVVDLLGYGRSERPRARDLSLKGHTNRLIALLDLLRIEYAAVVGHDLGGAIAQAMSLRAPARITRLCLISTVGFDEWPSREVRLARAALPLTRHLPATWLLSILRSDLVRGYADGESGARSVEQYIHPFASAEGRDAFMEHLNALDPAETQELAPRLKDIVAPTAIVWGAHDPFIPATIAKRLHESIPGSTLDVLPEGRHFLPEESPEKLASIIAALMTRDE